MLESDMYTHETLGTPRETSVCLYYAVSGESRVATIGRDVVNFRDFYDIAFLCIIFFILMILIHELPTP